MEKAGPDDSRRCRELIFRREEAMILGRTRTGIVRSKFTIRGVQ